MNRRTLLGGLAGAVALGGGALLLTRGAAGEELEPVEYEAVWTPDETTVLELPEPGRVTLLEFFATDCDTCQTKMPMLRSVHEQIDPAAVQLVSLSIDAVGGTIDHEVLLDWWETYDGSWPMASESDHDLHFMRELGVGATPWTAIVDADNRIVTDEMGFHSTDELLAMIEDAR